MKESTLGGEKEKKMNKTKIAFGIGIILTVLAVLTASAAAEAWEGYLIPQDGNGSCGGDVLVEYWVNYTSTGGTEGNAGYQCDIRFDPSCINITGADFSESPFSYNGFTPRQAFTPPDHIRLMGEQEAIIPFGLYKMATLTVHCECESEGCVSELHFQNIFVVDPNGDELPYSYTDGTFTCTAPQETYSKELVEGWNLISLPLTADDMTVSSVFSSVAGKYDAIYSYDATTHSWVALGDDDTVENGVGYFINMTESGTWTYQGSAYTTMSISLEPGLNMVGWLNCSKPIDDALSSIEGNYRYVARWNSTAHKFEVYVPGAPSGFNDFNTMERGEGYFISMKTSDTLTASC